MVDRRKERRHCSRIPAEEAPCRYEGYNTVTRQMQWYKPAYTCEYGCDGCGWNPEEIERRRRAGVWETVRFRNNAETGEVVSLPKGVQRLRFPMAEDKKRALMKKGGGANGHADERPASVGAEAGATANAGAGTGEAKAAGNDAQGEKVP